MTEFELEGALRARLSPEETLLWTGRPRQGILLKRSDIFLIPFSLFWFGGVVFWEIAVLSNSATRVMALFGIPFLLVGLYITVGRLFVDDRNRENSIYGITPDRAIILSGAFERRVRSVNIKTLSDISIKERGDGSGTLFLGPAPLYAGLFMRNSAFSGADRSDQFESIPDVKGVYDLLIQLQNKK